MRKIECVILGLAHGSGHHMEFEREMYKARHTLRALKRRRLIRHVGGPMSTRFVITDRGRRAYQSSCRM